MKKALWPAFASMACALALSSCGKDALEASDASQLSRGQEIATEASLSGDLKSDSLALVDLYKSLNGDQWYHSSGWLSETPLNQWEGVRVSNEAGKPRVVALWLGGNNLQGELPASLAKLTALRSLQLQYNRDLKGTFPEVLYKLTQLRALRLAMTSISGSLSDRLGDLKMLDTLDLRTSPYDLSMWWDGNMATAKDHRPNKARLTGTLPASIGQLSNLRFLDLSNQQLTGELPQSLGELSQLDTLELSNCRFSGSIPSSLGKIASLQYLSLAGNQLSGEIPATLGSLRQLRELWLGRNELSGKLPDLSALQALKQLGLDHNQLSGEIPASLSQLKNLYTLYLSANKLEGNIPTSFGGTQQANLIWADLSHNNLTGKIPQRVRHTLPNAEQYKDVQGLPDYGYTIFALQGNRLTGDVPAEYLAYPKTLKHLVPQQEGYGFSNFK